MSKHHTETAMPRAAATSLGKIHSIQLMRAVAIANILPFLKRVDPAFMSIPIALVSLCVGEALHHKIERPLLKRPNSRRSLIPEREDPAEPARR